MEHLRNKSQAELNSQALAFAAYEVDSWDDKKEVAAMVVQDMGMVATQDLYPQYVEFLRNNREDIRKRNVLQKEYSDKFKPNVDSLRQTLQKPGNNYAHDSYLGGGTGAEAFSLEKDGKEYVVRTLVYEKPDTVSIEQYLAGVLEVQGLAHFEQMVAISYEDKVTIAERMPGVESNNVPLDDIDQISGEQLGELVESLKIAQERGIVIDPNNENFLYDKEKGFGLIDFYSARMKSATEEQSIGAKLAQVSTVISQVGNKTKKYSFRDKDKMEYYQQEAAFATAQLNLLTRYRHAVEQTDIDEENHEYALHFINTCIEHLADTMNRHSDPLWIEQQMEGAITWRVPEFKPSDGLTGWDTVDVSKVDTSRF